VLLWFLVAVPVHAGDLLLIATWNVRNLGHTSPEADVLARAAVVQEFDIVALQEVNSERALLRLVEALNNLGDGEPGSSCWEHRISHASGDSGNATYHYAFVYRTDSVAYIEGSEDHYGGHTGSSFCHNPFWASFRANGFDFTLIAVHIKPNGSATEKNTECAQLAAVWQHVQDQDPLVNDLLLLGDFNVDQPTHPAFGSLRQLGLTPVVDSSQTRTTYGDTEDGGSFYDNLWIDQSHTADDLTEQFGTGTPLENTMGRGCSEVLRGVSDHCPVWAAFSTLQDEDPRPAGVGDVSAGRSTARLAT